MSSLEIEYKRAVLFLRAIYKIGAKDDGLTVEDAWDMFGLAFDFFDKSDMNLNQDEDRK